MKLRRKKIIQSKDFRIGKAQDLTVTLLPNRFFQRLKESNSPLVFHPVVTKGKKLEVFKENGFLFSLPIRINNRYSDILIFEKFINKFLRKNFSRFTKSFFSLKNKI